MADPTLTRRKAAQVGSESPDMARKQTKSETTTKPETLPPPPAPPVHDWLDPGTWSGPYKYMPVYVLFTAVLTSIIYFQFFHQAEVDLTSYASCVGSFDYGFRINAASTQAHDWSKHSQEIGMAYEATLQIYNPERGVFGADPFPGGKIPKLGMRMDEAAVFAQKKVKLLDNSLFDEDEGSVSGPATMGIAALMLAQRWPKDYMPAATRQKDILLEQAPRHSDGAISHRFEQVELRSEAVGMFSPFLAYYGVATGNLSLVQEAVHQCRLYRDILSISKGSARGLWKHSEGKSADSGPWSSGNAWAAYGMARVSATLAAWPESSTKLSKEKDELDTWVGEIIDGAIRTDTDTSKLLRNYLGDNDWSGETSGTSLLAATVYRMASIKPEVFAQAQYLDWADEKRRAVFRHVDDNGFTKPAANPYMSTSKEPVDVSPEGESFLLLMGTAWRDYVCSGGGLEKYSQEVLVEKVRFISGRAKRTPDCIDFYRNPLAVRAAESSALGNDSMVSSKHFKRAPSSRNKLDSSSIVRSLLSSNGSSPIQLPFGRYLATTCVTPRFVADAMPTRVVFSQIIFYIQ